VFSEPVTVSSSPCYSSNRVDPSRDTHADPRLSKGFLNFKVVETGSIKGLKLRE
jgi:hypothetical protein